MAITYYYNQCQNKTVLYLCVKWRIVIIYSTYENFIEDNKLNFVSLLIKAVTRECGLFSYFMWYAIWLALYDDILRSLKIRKFQNMRNLMIDIYALALVLHFNTMHHYYYLRTHFQNNATWVKHANMLNK